MRLQRLRKRWPGWTHPTLWKRLPPKARAVFGTYQLEPVVIVPAHGDWQPRNWLMDLTELGIIDFGRYGYRPVTSDFCRLAV